MVPLEEKILIRYAYLEDQSINSSFFISRIRDQHGCEIDQSITAFPTLYYIAFVFFTFAYLKPHASQDYIHKCLYVCVCIKAALSKGRTHWPQGNQESLFLSVQRLGDVCSPYFVDRMIVGGEKDI